MPQRWPPFETPDDAPRGDDVGALDPTTEVLTTSGPRPVSTLSTSTRVYALDTDSGVATPTPVTTLRPVTCDELIHIETRRADLRVSPACRIPFVTRAIDDPRFVRADAVADRASYTFLDDWTTPSHPGLSTVDITDHLDDYEMCATTDVHGHTFRAALPEGCTPRRRNNHVGYCFGPETFERHQSTIERLAESVTIHAGRNHHRRPYRFDGDDFLRFLGWYCTEGSVTWSTTSDTAEVKIAQETSRHRRAIAALFDRLGLDVTRGARKFSFGSVVFGRLLERLCGASSRTKHLPPFIWTCSTRQQRLLLDVLLRGDGDERGTYYTTSTALAADLLRLCAECGIKPRYGRGSDCWRVYVRDVHDGFKPAAHVTREPAPTTMVNLRVRDGRPMLAGRNGTFQWIGGGDSA